VNIVLRRLKRCCKQVHIKKNNILWQDLREFYLNTEKYLAVQIIRKQKIC
jgi:hypothetical protein